MKESLFKFKRFSVSHSRSSMKVGVDGVMIGAWASAEGQRLLDVGTGCGMIALMLAQRNAGADILGIDIHESSVEEAIENFNNSPWRGRLRAEEVSFSEIVGGEARFDLIVSNPPYFNSGITDPESPREVARHQGTLSPTSLIEGSALLLNPGGRLAMIVPEEYARELLHIGTTHSLPAARICRVKGHPGAPVKRAMIEFVKDGVGVELEEELLVMFGPDGEPTDRYRELCRDFYLKF